jgi:hypothetical protein
MPVATTRAALKTALQGVTANVYDHVPESVIPPACVVVPSSPYIEINTIGKSSLNAQLNFTITLVVAFHSNAAALDNLERLYFQVLAALPANYVVGVLEKPAVTAIGASDMLAADFNVSTRYTN